MSFLKLSRIIVRYVMLFCSGTACIAMAQNPVPVINQPLVPDAAKPGAAGFPLTVSGTGFVSGATVFWNGSPLATTFVSGSSLTASVPSSDVAKASTASVTVANPAPGGGTSNVAFFEITSASTSVALGTPSAFAIGVNPNAAAVGDFNGDGKLDLVAANGGGNVSILLGKGDGTFQPAVNYVTGSYSFSPTTGDFNRDGKLDLAVANRDRDNVSILLGNGDGTFQSAVDYPTGSWPLSVVVGDFNRDGKLDLAVANQQSNNVSVFLGNGDGTFQTAVDYGAAFNPNSVAVGDFNGDGKLDLAVANIGSNNVSILLGSGDGTFQSPVDYPAGSGPVSVVVGDFNRDGKLDLAVANQQSNNVSVFLGNGDGTFQTAVDYAILSQSWSNIYWITAGDLNGDGNSDLVVVDWGIDGVDYLLGNGDGTFQAAVLYSAPYTPTSVALGDFNSDGRLDIVYTDFYDGTASIFLQIAAVSLSNTSLTYANQVVGTSSAQTVTLTNGALPLTISSIAVTGTDAADFSERNNCGPGLPPVGKCTIRVTFTPTQVGPRTASVTISDNAGGSPQSIALSGTGVVSGPNVTLSTTNLTFATQLLGTTSPVQSVTLTDYGTAALSITSISLTGPDASEFQQTNTCGSSVLPGASCTITLTFRPNGINTRTASLLIADNAAGSPQTLSLSGTGTEVKLNPASLAFGTVSGQSKSLPTKLTNLGSTTLSISSFTITGAYFTQTNNCGSIVGAGKSCTITVTFKPEGTGFFQGTVSISDNGGGSPQSVGLSGCGNRCFAQSTHTNGKEEIHEPNR